MSERRFALSFSALALPPTNPPFLPNATAAGFLPSMVVFGGATPVAISATSLATPIASLVFAMTLMITDKA